MKDLNIKMLAAAMTLVFASCNNEGITGDKNTDGEVRFSATIDGASRSYDQVWEANDEIGISCQTGDVVYNNVCYYTSSADGNFSPKDESKKIYFQTDEEVTFTAYYPWNDIQEGTAAVTADTWKQSEQKKFDFLWAQAEGRKSNPDVSFAFAHKMTKLVLTIKRGDDVSYDEVKAAVLSLEGFKNEGSFDVATGTAAASGNDCAEWIFAGNTANAEYNAPKVLDDAANTVVYTMIFYPQKFDSPVTFTAKIAEHQSFSANLYFVGANSAIDRDTAEEEWVSGRQYNIGIKMNKTGISLDGCTIAAWDEVSDEVDANM